jgi:hypothetical protein
MNGTSARPRQIENRRPAGYSRSIRRSRNMSTGMDSNTAGNSKSSRGMLAWETESHTTLRGRAGSALEPTQARNMPG